MHHEGPSCKSTYSCKHGKHQPPHVAHRQTYSQSHSPYMYMYYSCTVLGTGHVQVELLREYCACMSRMMIDVYMYITAHDTARSAGYMLVTTCTCHFFPFPAHPTPGNGGAARGLHPHRAGRRLSSTPACTAARASISPCALIPPGSTLSTQPQHLSLTSWRSNIICIITVATSIQECPLLRV